MAHEIVNSSGYINCGALYGNENLGTIMDRGGAMERLENVNSFYAGNGSQIDTAMDDVKSSSEEIIMQ